MRYGTTFFVDAFGGDGEMMIGMEVMVVLMMMTTWTAMMIAKFIIHFVPCATITKQKHSNTAETTMNTLLVTLFSL